MMRDLETFASRTTSMSDVDVDGVWSFLTEPQRLGLTAQRIRPAPLTLGPPKPFDIDDAWVRYHMMDLIMARSAGAFKPKNPSSQSAKRPAFPVSNVPPALRIVENPFGLARAKS